MTEPTEAEVLERAKLTFLAKSHDDRAWDKGATQCEADKGHSVMCLTEEERQEYLEQARHELRAQPRDYRPVECDPTPKEWCPKAHS
jgi:hypothetical protein